MTTVGIVDGLKYGFRYLAVLVGVVLLSGSFVAGGGALAYTGLDLSRPLGSEVLPVVAGGFVALVGLLVFHGMLFGLVYKFLADSVVAGVEAADVAVALSDEATIAVEDTAEGGAAVAGQATAATAADTAEAAGEGETARRGDRDDGGVGTTGTQESAVDDGPDGHRGTGGAVEDTGAGTVDGPDAPAADEAAGADSGPVAADSADERATEGTAETGGDSSPGQTAAEPTGEELDRVVSEATQPGGEEPSSTTLLEEGAPGEEAGSPEGRTAGEDDSAGGTDRETGEAAASVQREAGGDEAGEQPPVSDADPVPDTAAGGPVEDSTETPTDEPGEPVAGPDDRATESHPGATDTDDDQADTDPLGMGTAGDPSDTVGDRGPTSEPADGPPVDGGDGDGNHGADDGSPEESGPAGEPVVDDGNGDTASAGDGGDAIDEAFEAADEATNPIADLDDGEVEDTTDEPGDWEPLDESDLKD